MDIDTCLMNVWCQVHQNLNSCFSDSDQYFHFQIFKTICITYAGGFKMDTDVFAFGVILLELFTCSKDEDLLAHLLALRNGAKKLKKNKSLDVRETRPFLFTEIIDPRLGSHYHHVDAAAKIGTLIQKCIRVEWKKRQLMQQAVIFFKKKFENISDSWRSSN